MKKTLLIIIFIIGLGIFSYPLVSNYFSTKSQQAVVKEYREAVQQLDKTAIKNEQEKANIHNEKLESAQLNFVDPFSDDKIESAGNKSYYDALNIGPALGNLSIPKIDAQLPIYHGTKDDVLSRGVGHLENSSLPTGKKATHSVFTAHRGLPSSELFRDLDQVIVGDQFFIEILDEVYTYEVYELDIVLPHETDWLQIEKDKELVTLLTCEPYMINTHRLLVKGKRVPHTNEQLTDRSQEALSVSWYIIAAVIGILSILVIAIAFRKARGNVEET